MSDKRLKANVVAELLIGKGALLAEPKLFSDEGLYRILYSYGWEWDGRKWEPWA